MSGDPRLDAVLSRLKKVKKTARGFIACCPAHDDKNPSLSVGIGRDWVLLHCYSGCSTQSVLDAIGLKWKDVALRDREPPPPPLLTNTGRPVKEAIDRRGMALEAAACVESLQADKSFLERLRMERGWAASSLRHLGVGLGGDRLTLLVHDKEGNAHDVLRYDPFLRRGRKVLAGEGRSRLPWPAPERVQPNGHPLFIVEGEGTAISLASIGLNAVGLPGSIGKPKADPLNPGSWRGVGWHKSWARRFDGHARIVCMPDSDEQGRALMFAVSYDLERIGFNVATLDLRGKKDGFDVGDMLQPARTLVTRREAKVLLLEAATTARQHPLKVDEAIQDLREWYMRSRNGSSHA